ncbi:WDR46 [Enterospora canceri]|uniref:WDR46 n=1 Tax=Enterospora canceri TaxID=1081671 RepID=A0A1Y1S8G8_9MICR|nr:WDR46 [Enterospora canceri]
MTKNNQQEEKRKFDILVKKNEKENKLNEMYSEIAHGNKREAKLLKRVKLGYSEHLLEQEYIKENVNLYTKEKAIKLDLETKPHPYNTCYNQNGSHSLIWNRDGFAASFGTQSLMLDFESDFTEISTATYLHSERYIALGQECLYIYNNRGVELHAVRSIKNILQSNFLPDHFLLGCMCCTSTSNKLKYLDTTSGEIAAELDIKFKPVASCHFDGIICLGDRRGVVDLVAPKQPEPLMKIKVHRNIKELKRGKDKLYVSTYDNKIKTFDLRNYFKPLQEISTKYTDKMAISTNGTVALGGGSTVVLFDPNEAKINQEITTATNIGSLEFNPFEDILTVTTRNKYESFVAPQSSDIRYNADVISPYMTKNEKREMEVKKLLEKIPPEMISYNSELISKIRRDKKVRPICRQ